MYAFTQPATITLDGRVIPLQFPYMNTLMHGRPKHDGDSFYFKHPPMPPGKRAKIFAPFDALDGYGDAVRSKDVEYVCKVSLDEADREELNRRLEILHNLTFNGRMARQNRVQATITYYVPCTDQNSFAYLAKGQYKTVQGIIWKVDFIGETVKIGDSLLSMGDILNIEAEGVFDVDWELDAP